MLKWRIWSRELLEGGGVKKDTLPKQLNPVRKEAGEKQPNKKGV